MASILCSILCRKLKVLPQLLAALCLRNPHGRAPPLPGLWSPCSPWPLPLQPTSNYPARWFRPLHPSRALALVPHSGPRSQATVSCPNTRSFHDTRGSQLSWLGFPCRCSVEAEVGEGWVSPLGQCQSLRGTDRRALLPGLHQVTSRELESCSTPLV